MSERIRRIVLSAAVTAAFLLAVAAPAHAGSITFTGSQGSLAASATFTDSGGNLIITLTNTSSSDVMDPSDVLTGVFFTSTDTTLTPLSALVATGSTIVYDTADSNGVPITAATTNVGGEWTYDASIGGQYGATQGISSSGLGIFGADNFNGPDMSPPAADPDGVAYGILSAGDNLATGNNGVTDPGTQADKGGMVKNSVVFTLSGWTGGVLSPTSTAISNVTFQYGTALNEPHFGGGGGNNNPLDATPEPASLILLGSGLAFAAKAVRRKKSE